MHFILRPELFTQTTRPSCVVVCDLRNAKRIADATCAKCEKRVGHDLPFGPKGRHFVAFGSDAVKVFGVCHGRKALWTQLCNQDQFMNIERRNPSNFLNVAAARSGTQAAMGNLDMQGIGESQNVQKANLNQTLGGIFYTKPHPKIRRDLLVNSSKRFFQAQDWRITVGRRLQPCSVAVALKTICSAS